MPDIISDKFRSLSPFIREQLPAFVGDSESLLPDFLEAYYEWMETTDKPSEIIHKAAQAHDINSTIEKFYDDFKYEYLNKFPTSINVDKDTLVKNIREFYRAKGTEKAVKLLFRILFNEEIEVNYPSEQILKPSSGTYVRKTFIRIVTNQSNIFDISEREVYFLEQKIVLENVSGTYVVGETVISKDTLGNSYETGEIHSIESNSIVITTNFEGQFRKRLILEGQTSNATGTIIQSENFSKRGYIENVTLLSFEGQQYYQAEVSGLFDVVKPNLIVRTIHNDENNEVIEFRNSPMIIGAEISNGGQGYTNNTNIPLIDTNDGVGGAVSVESVKTLVWPILGAFTSVTPLPSNTLQCTSTFNEKINEVLSVGDIVKIDELPYVVSSFDIPNNRVSFKTDIISGANLNTIVKSHKFDSRAITRVKITNPGFGYTTAPSADVSSLSGSGAIISLKLGGSFTQEFGHIDDKGQLSSTMKLQNDGIYQQFSYTIKSGASINLWRDILKDHVHPAGMLVTGEIASISEITDGGSLTYTSSDVHHLIDIGNRFSIRGSTSSIPEESVITSTFETNMGMVDAGILSERNGLKLTPIDTLPNDSINFIINNFNGNSIARFGKKYSKSASQTLLVIKIQEFSGSGAIDWDNLRHFDNAIANEFPFGVDFDTIPNLLS